MTSSKEGSPRRWAIAAKRLVDGAGNLVQDGIVVVEGEQISAVGPAAEIDLPAGTEVMDAATARCCQA